MPEYIPRVQLPQGLAAEAIRLAAQRGPLLAQGITQAGQAIGAGLSERSKNRIEATPEVRQVFEQAGMPLDDSVTHVNPFTLRVAGQKAAARDKFQAQLDALNYKTNLLSQANQVPVDEQVKSIMTQAGMPVPTSPTVDKRIVDDASHIAMYRTRITGGASSEDIPRIAAMVKAGNLALSQVPSYVKTQVVAYLAKENPYIDLLGSDTRLSALKHYYNTMNAPATQSTLKYMNSVILSSRHIQDFVKKLDRTRYPTFNEIVIQGMRAAGNPDEMAFATDVLLVADEVAKILQGSSNQNSTSDAKLRQASQMFKSSYSPEDLSRIMGEIRILLQYRKDEMLRDTKVLPEFNPETLRPSAPASAPESTPASTDPKKIKASSFLGGILKRGGE